MSQIVWTGVATDNGGIRFGNELNDEYEILQDKDNAFFVKRNVADCDDIGPFETFDLAEQIILQIAASLMEFEEKLWLVIAARNLPKDYNDGAPEGGQMLLPGTAIIGVDGEPV
jgi:hypothetical protein